MAFKTFALALGVFLLPSALSAATYCRTNRLPYFPGQDGTAQMTAVVETVPRVIRDPGAARLALVLDRDRQRRLPLSLREAHRGRREARPGRGQDPYLRRVVPLEERGAGLLHLPGAPVQPRQQRAGHDDLPGRRERGRGGVLRGAPGNSLRDRM